MKRRRPNRWTLIPSPLQKALGANIHSLCSGSVYRVEITPLLHFSQDVALSLGVLDSVIGEFDDGFLSESDGHTIRASRAERTKGQFSPNGNHILTVSDKIARVWNLQGKLLTPSLSTLRLCCTSWRQTPRQDFLLRLPT